MATSAGAGGTTCDHEEEARNTIKIWVEYMRPMSTVEKRYYKCEVKSGRCLCLLE